MSYLDDYKKGLEKRQANPGSTRDSTASNQGDKTVAERSDDYMGEYLRGLERRNDRPVYSSGVGQNYITNFMKRSNEILSGIKIGTYRTDMQELQELGQQSSAIRKFLHDNPSQFPREVVRILEDRMNELDSATRSTSWAVRTDMLDEARAGMESSQGKSRYQENQEAMAEESARLRKKWEGSLNPYLYGPGGYQPNEHYNMVGQEQAEDYFDLSSMAQEKVWMDTVAKYTGKEFKDNFWGQFGANYTMGRLGQDSSMAWNKYLDDPTEQNRRDAETIDQLITEIQLNNGDTLADDGTLPWISKTLANYIPQFLDQMKYSGSLGAVGALTGNPKGVKAGIVMGSGVYSYMTMRGAAFKSLLEAGIPEEQARAAAKDESVVSSLIEMGDTAIDLATLGGGKLINVLTAGSLDAIKNQIAKGVGKNVLTKLATALAKYGINIGSEWLEEATQESVSIANQNNPGGGIPGLVQDAAGVFFGSVLDPESEEGQQIREAGEEGAKIAAMMGGIQGVTNAAAARVSTNYQAKQAYGPYSQELIQEAKILNPDSQLAEKLQGQIDSKKDLSGRQIVNMVRENQNAFEKQVNPETTLEEASQKYGSQAKAMESIYRMGNGKQEIGKFDAAYKLAYDMGKNDVRLEYVMQSPSTQYLTETQRAFAYQTGQFAAKNQEQTSNVDANQVAQTKQTRDNETKQAAAENAGDGKTILSKTGEEVKVKEIASNESGKQTLLLEDGRTVDASDVSFGSSGEALVYETVAQMGVDAKSANTLVRNYVPGQGITAQEYSQQIQDAYRFGKLNFPETELAVSAQTNKLTQQQRMEAYRQGKKAGELETDTAETSAREKKKAAPKEKGKVHFDGDRSKLTKAQKVGLTALDKVADNLNLQVYIFESEVDENGNRIGANGWYDSKDNSIHIDLHAGMDGKGTILFTAAHELTHHIKELSPEKFRALADFLNQEYGKRGVSIDDLVTGQIEKSARAGVELTYDEAYEEMVADSMETMLSDGKVLEKLEKLKTSERSLWETIREYIADLAAKIRQVYSRLLPDSAEGRYVAQMRDSIEKLQDLFVEGLADASANYQTKTSGTEVVMDGENLKYQTRSFQDQVDELIEGKIPSDSAVYVGKTPSILAEIGFDGNLPMLVTQKHIKDAIAPKNDEMHHHGLTVDQVKSIPDKLKSPVMLIDSFKSGSNTVLAVIDEVDPDGCPVVVAIKADGSGRFNGILVDSNFITSMYGRERFVKFLERCIKWNKLLYVDQKKSQSLSISSSVQFAEQLKGISSNVIIRKSDVIVNEKNNPARDFYGRNLDNTSPGDKVKFSMRSSVEETKDDTADRLEKVNSVEGAKFQQRERRPETVVQMLQDQNAKLREDLKDAREMVKLQGQVTGGKLLRQSSIESAARHLKQKWDIGGNTKELAALLKPFYDHILNGEEVSWETVRENAQPVVDFMIQNEKTHMDSYAESVLSSLNGRKIRLNERQRAEVESAFGSVRDFQNAISGTVKLSNDGMPLDSFFAEMNAEFPDQFPADLNDADMPAALAGIVDTMRSMDKPNTFGMDPMVIEQDMVRDVYDSYWRVSTLYTVADKYNRQIQDMKGKQAQKVDALRERKDQEIDRKIANLKKAHDERIQKIRADQRERIANLREEQKQVLERTRDKYRKRLNEQHEELTKKYTESRKKAIQSRKKTHMRNRIRSVVKDIDAILNHGTKERNVKEGLKDTVYKSLRLAEVLFGDMRPETILKGDIQSVTKEEKENLERYRNLLKQRNEAKDRLDNLNKDTVDSAEAWNAANPEREQLEMTLLETRKELSKLRDKLQEVVEREKNRLMAQGSVSQAIDALAEEYQSLQDSTEAGLQWAYDEEVHNRILQLKDDLKNAVIDEMSLQQLEDVHDLYTMVLTTIRNANKAFRDEKGETITNIASEVMSQLGSQKSQPELQTKAAEGINRFRWNNLKPVYAFERIGSPTFAKLFNRVRSGEDTWAVDVTEARDFFREQAKKYNFDSWDFDTTHTFESASGSQFSLSLQQIMSLYAFSKREQALDHLRRGGIVIDSTTEVTKKTALGINRKFNPTKATSYNIKDATLADIVSKLTDEQKAFADAMQDYLSTTMGAKGNEVSMELYGIKMFKEKNYFPLRSATQFMAKAKEQQMVDPKIKNKGFTKETVRKASNPIVLTPFMNVWAGHVNEMSMYHAFTLPMEDFYRVYSFKTPTSEKTAMKSVEMLLQNAHGKAATAYIDQLLRDLNGGVRADASAGIINKSIGMFKKGAVFASMSVVVQQPSAIARAAALIDTKYFIGPKVDSKRHAALWDEVKKYAPIAIIKEMGYFDTNMGLSTYDFITSKEYSGFREKMKAVVSDSNYRDEILSKAPALADELAWCGIWEAVKRETAANNESLNRNSEEFLRKCGERFTEVIVKTQVYDSVLARSALMRSKDTGVKMATAFMAEPTTSINMIEDALIKGKNGNRKYARKAIGSVIASVILNSILVSFVYAGRDDDDEKTYVEKYLGSLTGSIIDSMNPGTYIPFIRDIVSIVQGYDVERSDMTVVSDIWNAWKKMGRDDLPPYRKVEDFVGSISQIFGLPVKNIMRDARGIYNTINSFLGGKKTTWTGVRYAVQENLPGIIGGKEASRQNRLYTAIVNGDASYVERMKGSYKDESSYNSAVRAALRSNDSRIQEAATARLNGDLNTYTTIAKKIIKEGHFDQDTVVLAISAEVNAMDGEESTSSTTKAQSLYDADDFTTAIIQDDQDMAATIQQEIIRVAELNGKTNEEAADSFARSAESALKEEFLTWNIGKSQAVNAITKYCDEEKENAEETVDGWQFEQEWGFAYSQRKSAYKSGQITSSELRTILMDMGGKTAEEAEQDIACYDWEMEVPGSEGISYAAIRDYHASVEPYGVTKETYTQAWKIKNAAKGVDADGDGKKDAYSVVQEVFPQIAALPISAEQKDALAHCWWADSTVKKYKTW